MIIQYLYTVVRLWTDPNWNYKRRMHLHCTIQVHVILEMLQQETNYTACMLFNESYRIRESNPMQNSPLSFHQGSIQMPPISLTSTARSGFAAIHRTVPLLQGKRWNEWPDTVCDFSDSCISFAICDEIDSQPRDLNALELPIPDHMPSRAQVKTRITQRCTLAAKCRLKRSFPSHHILHMCPYCTWFWFFSTEALCCLKLYKLWAQRYEERCKPLKPPLQF